MTYAQDNRRGCCLSRPAIRLYASEEMVLETSLALRRGDASLIRSEVARVLNYVLVAGGGIVSRAAPVRILSDQVLR